MRRSKKVYLRGQGGNAISYSELIKIVHGFKTTAKEFGFYSANIPIAVWADKSPEIIALLSSLIYSGNAYLPLNPDWPHDRIKFIIEKAKVKWLIADDLHLEMAMVICDELGIKFALHALEGGLTILKLSQTKEIRLPKKLSYVLFTSGSTGYPKGIVHTHESAMAFLNWSKKEFAPYKVKRHVSISPLNFDLSVYDVFHTLNSTSTLFVPNASTVSNTRLMAQYLHENKIESIYSTPSYLQLLEQTGKLSAYDFRNVKLILIAGETLTSELVNRLRVHFKKAVFYNLYGPTETNVCCAYKIDFRQNYDEYIPIGKSIIAKNVKISPQGELCYKGKLLMSGFINEKGYFSLKKGQWYKSGDFVKWTKGGKLEFVGRKDNLIKRHGFRIELSEINAVLNQHPDISFCVTLYIKDDGSIVSFVESGNDLSQLALKTFCLKHLPSYMLPDLIVVLQKIPLNLNHKADLAALRQHYAQLFKS